MFKPIPIDEKRRYSHASNSDLTSTKKKEKETKSGSNFSQEEIEEHALAALQSFSRVMSKISSNSLFDCILDGLYRQQKSSKYVDDNFPASLKSLIPAETQQRKQWKSIQWMRPNEFIKGSYTLLPEDKLSVKQGNRKTI